jgi:hypothetical protein
VLVTSDFDSHYEYNRKQCKKLKSSDKAANLSDDPDSTAHITPEFNEVITNCDLTDMEGKGTELFEYIPEFYTA